MTSSRHPGQVVAVARGLEVAVSAPGPARAPGSHEQALEVFIGRWINEGSTTGEPGEPGAPIITSDVYEWAPGGFFVLHSAYGRIGDSDVGGIEIIGFDPASGSYRSRFFDSFGNESVSKLTVADGVWTWQGEQTRATATFEQGGKVQRARHERSDDGRTWQQSMLVTLRRIS